MEHDSESDDSILGLDACEANDEPPHSNTNEATTDMSSGDGPVVQRHKKSTFRVPVTKQTCQQVQPSTSKGDDGATATEKNMVRKKRTGYTAYPAYLNDVPPLELNIESLRREFLIAKIEAAKKQTNFYDNTITFMGFVKESLCSIVEVNGFKLSKANKEGEHDYTMSQDLFNAEDLEGSK